MTEARLVAQIDCVVSFVGAVGPASPHRQARSNVYGRCGQVLRYASPPTYSRHSASDRFRGSRWQAWSIRSFCLKNHTRTVLSSPIVARYLDSWSRPSGRSLVGRRDASFPLLSSHSRTPSGEAVARYCPSAVITQCVVLDGSTPSLGRALPLVISMTARSRVTMYFASELSAQCVSVRIARSLSSSNLCSSSAAETFHSFA